MHFSLVYVSEKSSAWVDQVGNEYVKRLPPQFGFTQCKITPVKRSKNTALETARAVEWQRVIEKVAKNAFIVLLDERGKQFSSATFAQQLSHWQEQGQDIVFVIAGADGVNEVDRNSADFLLSLSQFTLPHELARVLLTEQLYRGWAILNNHPYHRS